MDDVNYTLFMQSAKCTSILSIKKYISHNATPNLGDDGALRQGKDGGPRNARATFVLLFVAVRWRRSEIHQLRGWMG